MLLALVIAGVSAGLHAQAETDGEALSRDLARRAERLGIDHIPLPNRLTDSMKEWLFERVSRHAPPREQLDSLLHAMKSEKHLGIEYEAGFTGTAEQVFYTGTANCLSFTHLFVSMAREVGLPVYYVGVDRMERYRRSGDLIVITGHVAAAYGIGPDRELIEFNVVQETDWRLAHKIPDRRAHALYHANRGAELLQEGEIEEAARVLTMAAILDANLPDAWVNLGVARRRMNDLAGAEQAYRRAVELQPNYVPAYHNLLMLFAQREDRDGVGELLEILDTRRNRNPFIYLELGDLSRRGGELVEAERFYRRALRLDRSLAEPHAAIGIIALREGDRDRAQALLAKALELDPEDERARELAESLKRQPSRGR